jgi:hypothetical protein
MEIFKIKIEIKTFHAAIFRRQQECLLLQPSHIQRLNHSSDKVFPIPMKDKLELISPLPTQQARNGEGLQIGPEGEG